MKKIIEDNYKSIVKRGLITPNTTTQNFIDKLYEELNEVEEVCVYNNFNEHLPIENINKNNLSFELADVILTALNYARHYDIDHRILSKRKN